MPMRIRFERDMGGSGSGEWEWEWERRVESLVSRLRV
jgi:hypothetical protein